ncbi:MAG: ankyrin repeat domain-containing protein [Akkermansiaceae bacterium]|nr:ankyrin repeat domain-containing protein [Armatimonadota bacterium]
METVRLLLAAGANPNALDSERKTPLHNALHPKAIPEVVEALLAHGADPLITMVKNENALDYALKVGNAAITRLVLEQLPRGFMVGGRSDAYIEAAAPKDAVVGLQLLCSYGLVVGTRYPHGRVSPLHTAARYGAAGVLEMCLSAGSSPNVRDRLGRTPLYMAARYNRPDAITVLLRHGGDATIADKDGVTPLRIAQQKNKKHAVAVLTTVIPQPNL